MPTPFQHLVYAASVADHPAVPPPVRCRLREHSGPFLLGNIAPDIQSINGVSRVETHFYRLTDVQTPAAPERMLDTYPHLKDPWVLPPAQALFITGYLIHLAWDEIWARDIFIPHFRDAPHWPDRLSFFLHHNALRVRLDRTAYARLQRMATTTVALKDVEPGPWLPFIDVDVLREWRETIVRQLDDPSLIQTIEVFARRMRVPVEQLGAVVHEMAADGDDAGVPGLNAALARYEDQGRAAGLEVLLRYWRFADRLPLDGGAETPAVAAIEHES